jgi:hypothetical protein
MVIGLCKITENLRSSHGIEWLSAEGVTPRGDAAARELR